MILASRKKWRDMPLPDLLLTLPRMPNIEYLEIFRI